MAQENNMPIGVLTGRALLANRTDVSSALDLTPSQVDQIQKVVESLEGVAVDSLQGVDDAAKPIFTEKQWARLTELWIQFEGAFVLQNVEIADTLKLSTEVREKVKQMAEEYRDWWNTAIHKIKKSSDIKRIKDTARKVSGKMVALLDNDQKKRFTEMQGPKFKFAT